MNLLAKAAFFLTVFITVQPSFAQITVDLDVLTEGFTAKETVSSSTPSSPKPAASARPSGKPAASQKTAGKAKPVAKPVVKKASSPKKPAKTEAKKTGKPAEKYQVKENAGKDEHDRLKPRANPVPEVKILAADNGGQPDEEEESALPAAEPKISKHFLEQERLKQDATEQTESEETASDQPSETEEEQHPAREPVKSSFLTLAAPDGRSSQQKPETLLSSPAKEMPAKPVNTTPPPIKESVIHTSGKLTVAENSAILAKEIPEESATKKALAQKKELLHIFLFENRNSTLTEEMQTALDDTAEMMKKNKNKRLLLYAYSAPDMTYPGKERQYSLRRALMIRSYLTQKGIPSLRIEMRSFGRNGAGDKIPNRTDILTENK